ncbi:MAG: hypothetical protein WA884_10630 [Methyloceanibacter sp.]
MRELTSIELQAVSGGAMAIIARRPEPLFVRIVLRVLEDVLRGLEGGTGMRPAPRQPVPVRSMAA